MTSVSSEIIVGLSRSGLVSHGLNFEVNATNVYHFSDMERSSDESAANRIGKTLLASSVSLRLNCFHVFYLEKIARPKGRTLEDLARDYDAHYGRPTHTLKEMFLEGVKQIKNINTWEYVVTM